MQHGSRSCVQYALCGKAACSQVPSALAASDIENCSFDMFLVPAGWRGGCVPLMCLCMIVAVRDTSEKHRLGAGPPQKVGERVTRVAPVAKGPVEALLTSLNLGPQQGLDPEPENIVAVGTFTSTPPGQPPQQVNLTPVPALSQSPLMSSTYPLCGRLLQKVPSKAVVALAFDITIPSHVECMHADSLRTEASS